MVYYSEFITNEGEKLIIRNALPSDAENYIKYYSTAHSETEYLTTYPDEASPSVSETAERLESFRISKTDAEICAFAGERLVGSAGIYMIKNREKTRHRAGFGISIVKEYCGKGIGGALLHACTETAKCAGYIQLELEMVSGNLPAEKLYKKYGFTEYGRNPKGFRTRSGVWQELVLMRLEL